jgi:hypothetical protein
VIGRIRGTIRRRILLNFRVDPEVARRRLPPGFEPKVVEGYAVAGVCLIRLEHERLAVAPRAMGLDSENAAHRFAAFRVDDRGGREECVYIARRHSSSLVNRTCGGRIFPGESHPARFVVREEDESIDLAMSAPDGFSLRLQAHRASALPPSSIFRTLGGASSFFRGGSLGYSATRAGDTLDALRLDTARWEIAPLVVDLASSTYFDDRSLFPRNAIVLDCALLMRDVEHEWRRAPSLRVPVRDN